MKIAAWVGWVIGVGLYLSGVIARLSSDWSFAARPEDSLTILLAIAVAMLITRSRW